MYRCLLILAALSCVACAQQAPEGPRVEQVYPVSAEVPENILRFYVEFSEPMKEGDFLQHIRLTRVDTGEDLTGVFFDNIHELWSADRTRITLLVDPGRVKHGLMAHKERGRAFVDGGSYRLHILPSWESLRGAPLAAEHVHTFKARPERLVRLDPGSWCLKLPEPNSLQPLVVDFGVAVDHVSVHHLLRVSSPSGSALAGAWTMAPGGRSASWRPATQWGEDVPSHKLMISGRFEDIAGNSVHSSFERPPGTASGGDEGQVHVKLLGGSCELKR
ncbi:MAG: hypothetical protein AAGI01_08030 [Myxococcota bacterium]